MAYKLGELKIWELRGRAEATLGDAFDLRDFHDAVLSQGALPLSMLDDLIDRYIDATLARGKNSAACQANWSGWSILSAMHNSCKHWGKIMRKIITLLASMALVAISGMSLAQEDEEAPEMYTYASYYECSGPFLWRMMRYRSRCGADEWAGRRRLNRPLGVAGTSYRRPVVANFRITRLNLWMRCWMAVTRSPATGDDSDEPPTKRSKMPRDDEADVEFRVYPA